LIGADVRAEERSLADVCLQIDLEVSASVEDEL
jgi:hypothetical protein